MVWSYVEELIFSILVLAGAVKMADRVVTEKMGLIVNKKLAGEASDQGRNRCYGN